MATARAMTRAVRATSCPSSAWKRQRSASPRRTRSKRRATLSSSRCVGACVHRSARAGTPPRARRRGRRCASRSLVHSGASAHVDGRNRSHVLTHARTRPRVVQGDFAGARERYSAALAAAPAARGAGAAALAAARAVYHANRAAAALQAGDARTARDDCDASLRLAPGAPKVLMRRARALEALEEVEAAHADAQAAADAAEDNSAIQKDAKGACYCAPRCQTRRCAAGALTLTPRAPPRPCPPRAQPWWCACSPPWTPHERSSKRRRWSS